MKTSKEHRALSFPLNKEDKVARMSGKVSSSSLGFVDPVLKRFAKDLAKKGRVVTFNIQSGVDWPTSTGFNPSHVGSYIVNHVGITPRVRPKSTGDSKAVAARVRELDAAALAVWNNQTDASDWMNSKLYELADRTPIEACATDQGLEEAKKILLRIAYGLPA